MDPSQQRGRPPEHAGVIEEFDGDIPTPRLAGSVWDRVLVGLFAVAVVGGLIIAMTAELLPSGTSPIPTASPTPRPAFLWERTAEQTDELHALTSHVGNRYRYDCPRGGTPFPVWGTRVYNSDSSVCTAAVHVGLITLDDGGFVMIEIRRGRDSYRGTHRHGVTSLDWPGSSFHSFVFVWMSWSTPLRAT